MPIHTMFSLALVPAGHEERHLVPFRYLWAMFAMLLKHDRQVSFCWWLGQVAHGNLHLNVGIRLEFTLSIEYSHVVSV